MGHMAASSTSAPGPSHKRTEAKLVLQLATWMANTGQGAKSDITGLPQPSNLSSDTKCLFRLVEVYPHCRNAFSLSSGVPEFIFPV